ncbi:MAG: hypothetical protein JOZ97_05970 [Candidatus Eremiobacteraeota bacterium]|nr:hypothetical protein [Candidatus Eremiobacteraeota bacterium]
MSSNIKIVHELAASLDSDDYVAAEQLLEPDAIYHTGDSTILGRSEIIASFRATSEWGHRHLDALEFSHEIDDAKPSEIIFIDVLRKDGEELRLEHAMHVGISRRGLINELRLQPRLGERELVKQYFHRHGLTPVRSQERSE